MPKVELHLKSQENTQSNSVVVIFEKRNPRLVERLFLLEMIMKVNLTSACFFASF